MNPTRIRNDFRRAAEVFADTVAAVPPREWERPALGTWTVRDLVGHTSRALSTVASYLDPGSRAEYPELPEPVAYYRASATADPEAIAQRGRQAGLALGQDPQAAVRTLAQRVLSLVATAADDAAVATPVGTMTLGDYLPPRTFELVVHTLDLLRALAAPVPPGLREPLAAALQLAVRLSAESGHGAEVLLALTGRRPLPAGFTVL